MKILWYVLDFMLRATMTTIMAAVVALCIAIGVWMLSCLPESGVPGFVVGVIMIWGGILGGVFIIASVLDRFGN